MSCDLAHQQCSLIQTDCISAQRLLCEFFSQAWEHGAAVGTSPCVTVSFSSVQQTIITQQPFDGRSLRHSSTTASKPTKFVAVRQNAAFSSRDSLVWRSPCVLRSRHTTDSFNGNPKRKQPCALHHNTCSSKLCCEKSPVTNSSITSVRKDATRKAETA